MTLTDLLLMAGLAAANLYLWVSLGAKVRRSRLALPRLQVQFLPPERSPLPLLVAGLASLWTLAVLLPVVQAVRPIRRRDGRYAERAPGGKKAVAGVRV